MTTFTDTSVEEYYKEHFPEIVEFFEMNKNAESSERINFLNKIPTLYDSYKLTVDDFLNINSKFIYFQFDYSLLYNSDSNDYLSIRYLICNFKNICYKIELYRILNELKSMIEVFKHVGFEDYEFFENLNTNIYIDSRKIENRRLKTFAKYTPSNRVNKEIYSDININLSNPNIYIFVKKLGIKEIVEWSGKPIEYFKELYKILESTDI